MEFCKEKSHLSALQKVEFEENSTSKSSVSEIPGVGKKTTTHLETKNIKTIDDLINNIGDDFQKLCLVTPSCGINNHKIFDALETYLSPMAEEPIVREKQYSDTDNLRELQKITSCAVQ